MKTKKRNKLKEKLSVICIFDNLIMDNSVYYNKLFSLDVKVESKSIGLNELRQQSQIVTLLNKLLC